MAPEAARTFQKAIGKSSSNLCKHAGRLFMKEEIGMHLHTASRRWGLVSAVCTKWNTMEFLRTLFADENLFMWKIFMTELRKQEVTEYCVMWYLFLLEKHVHTYMYKYACSYTHIHTHTPQWETPEMMYFKMLSPGLELWVFLFFLTCIFTFFGTVKQTYTIWL